MAKPADILFENYPEVFPHCAAMGMRVVQRQPEVVVEMPFQPHFIGDPERNLIHNSVVASAADNATGMAVVDALPGLEAVATLDLHVDYLKPALGGKPLYSAGECYRITENIAFARATIWQDDRDEPVAKAVGTFMRDSNKNRNANQSA